MLTSDVWLRVTSTGEKFLCTWVKLESTSLARCRTSFRLGYFLSWCKGNKIIKYMEQIFIYTSMSCQLRLIKCIQNRSMWNAAMTSRAHLSDYYVWYSDEKGAVVDLTFHGKFKYRRDCSTAFYHLKHLTGAGRKTT